MSDNAKKWYGKNKEAYNKRRREKYAKDPEKRRRCIERATEYKAKAKFITPKFVMRTVGGVPTKMLSTGSAAKVLGIHETTIPSWERRGLIPKPLSQDNRRYYTMNQITLMGDLRDLLKDAVRGRRFLNERDKLVLTIQQLWES